MKPILSLLVALLSVPPNVGAAAPFVAGDRWCVLGDSITESGYCHRYVELFYCTRFPERKLDVVNCGIRGDTAPGALQRLQWDCLNAKPTIVSVMLGMNDVGRSFYKYKDSQDFDQKCTERAETYDQAMRKLTKSLLDSGAKGVLITPSTFDDTADLRSVNLPGCRAALAGYANCLRAIAGADKRFVWADAKIEGDTIIVNSPQVQQPVAVRYAWADNPAGCNLYNHAGLPASPFRTDDWK